MANNALARPVLKDTPDGIGIEMVGGMSRREWFAGQALIGLVMRNAGGSIGSGQRGWIAAEAYEIADAMLAASKYPPR